MENGDFFGGKGPSLFCGLIPYQGRDYNVDQPAYISYSMYVNKNIYGYETVKIRHFSQGKRENMGKCQPEMIKIGASPNKWRI